MTRERQRYALDCVMPNLHLTICCSCDTSGCAQSVGGESSGRLSSIYSIPGLRSAPSAEARAGGPIVAWVAVVGWWWVRQTPWLVGCTRSRPWAAGQAGVCPPWVRAGDRARSRESSRTFEKVLLRSFRRVLSRSRAAQRAIQSLFADCQTERLRLGAARY